MYVHAGWRVNDKLIISKYPGGHNELYFIPANCYYFNNADIRDLYGIEFFLSNYSHDIVFKANFLSMVESINFCTVLWISLGGLYLWKSIIKVTAI